MVHKTILIFLTTIIIRDPRNVLTSMMNHFEMNKDDTTILLKKIYTVILYSDFIILKLQIVD